MTFTTMVRDYPEIDSAVRIQPTESVFRLGSGLIKEDVCYSEQAIFSVLQAMEAAPDKGGLEELFPLLICCPGLSGLVALITLQRTKELGIRKVTRSIV
jgi:hypothetical protein